MSFAKKPRVGLIFSNALRFQHLIRKKSYEDQGYLADEFNIDDKDFEIKLTESILNNKYEYFITHNFKGVHTKGKSSSNIFKESNIELKIMMDTVFNKFHLFKNLPPKLSFSLADYSQRFVIMELTKNSKITDTMSHIFLDPKKDFDLLPLERRPIDVLFFGRISRHSNSFKRKTYQNAKLKVLNLYRDNPMKHSCFFSLVEDALSPIEKRLISPTGRYKKKYFDFLFDTLNFIRDKNRLFVADELKSLSQHCNVKVISDSPEAFEGYDVGHQTPQDWPKLIELMKKSKILIVTEPMHFEGINERFLTGLALGCHILTNENKTIRKEFKDVYGFSLYDFKEGSIINKTLEVLKHIQEFQSGVAQGTKHIRSKYFFKDRLNKIEP